MSDTPLGRARSALLEAKAAAERNPSGANLKALEEARAHVDYLLDTLPLVAFSTPPLVSPLLPSTPDGPGAQPPGPSVSSPLFVVGGEHWPSLEDELLGEHDSEGDK